MNITEDFYSKPAKLSPTYTFYEKASIKQRGAGNIRGFGEFLTRLTGNKKYAKRYKAYEREEKKRTAEVHRRYGPYAKWALRHGA